MVEIIFLIVGIAALAYGAKLAILSAADIAERIGIDRYGVGASVTAAAMLGTAAVGLKLSRDEEIKKWGAVGLTLTYMLVVWAELLASSL